MMEVLEKISNSQANTVLQCAKRWAYKYLDEAPEPPQAQLEHGTLVHAQIEKCLLNESIPEFSHVKYAVDFIDQLDPVEILVEKELNLSVNEQVTITGRADCIVQRENNTVIIDWKTKSKKPDTIMAIEVKQQLSLYGFLYGLKPGDQIIAVYPEWQIAVIEAYDKNEGLRAIERMLEAHQKRLTITENSYEAAEVKASPSYLCNWCSFKEICPDKKRNK